VECDVMSAGAAILEGLGHLGPHYGR
jgi:hypothetical protein